MHRQSDFLPVAERSRTAIRRKHLKPAARTVVLQGVASASQRSNMGQATTSLSVSPHSLQRARAAPPTGGGREELRATVLKPYVLRLRAERGEGAARALLASVGIPPSVLEDETGWISVAAAQRALSALATALGEDAIIH